MEITELAWVIFIYFNLPEENILFSGGKSKKKANSERNECKKVYEQEIYGWQIKQEYNNFNQTKPT